MLERVKSEDAADDAKHMSAHRMPLRGWFSLRKYRIIRQRLITLHELHSINERRTVLPKKELLFAVAVMGGFMLAPLAVADSFRGQLVEDSVDNDYFFICDDHSRNNNVRTIYIGPDNRFDGKYARSITLTDLGGGRTMYSMVVHPQDKPWSHTPAVSESCSFGRV